MVNRFGRRKKWIIGVVVLFILVALAGFFYWRSIVPKESDMERLERFFSEIGANFVAQDYDALKEQFASDGVFVHDGMEYSYEEGLEKLKETIDLVTEMEIGLTVINGSTDTFMKCTATGKLVYDDGKSLPEYKFELERTSKSYWKVTKMESPRSKWFITAFSSEQ